jgi:hypothetical protein
MTIPMAVEVRGLVKRFGRFTTVDGLDSPSKDGVARRLRALADARTTRVTTCRGRTSASWRSGRRIGAP